MTRWVGKHAFPVSPKITSQSMRMGLEINSLSIVSYVHVNWVTFNDLEENHSLGPCYSLNLSVLHRLMCLNTRSPAGGAVWEVYGKFRGWSLSGGCISLVGGL